MINNDDGNKEKKSESRYKNIMTEVPIGDFEISVSSKSIKPPIEILERLSELKENESLTHEEKSKQIQKILKDYME